MMFSRVLLTFVGAGLMAHPLVGNARSNLNEASLNSISLAQIYTEGSYGMERDTEMSASLLRWSHRRQQWGASITLPYLSITGPATVLFEDIDTGELFLEEIDENRSGFGDLVVSVDGQLWQRKRRGQKLSVGVAFKLPTGDDEQGLSSGELDTSIFLKGRWRKKSNVLNAQIGYQFVGDTEERDYDNRLLGTVGGLHKIDRDWGIGASARFKQASSEGRDHQLSVSGFVTHRLDKNWSLSLRAGRGFTDAVADFTLGAQINYSWRQGHPLLRKSDSPVMR